MIEGVNKINNVQAASAQKEAFVLIPDRAQYKGADWGGVVQVERRISREQALKIAESNPDIDYFFYVKGGQMVLEVPADARSYKDENPLDPVQYYPGLGNARIFQNGDAVFFSNKEHSGRINGQWWGTAPGLADGYLKESKFSDHPDVIRVKNGG